MSGSPTSFGLSSAVIQAKEAALNQSDGLEIAAELNELITDFREQRATHIEQILKARLAHRDALVELIEELNSRPAGSGESEAARAATIAERAEFLETWGEALRDACEALRKLRLQFRQQVREQLLSEGPA